ncbi:MAG: GAF domain-containing protein [Anaerolineales bacterium]
MSNTKEKKMNPEDLFYKGSEAQASYDYSTAIELYSQALGDNAIEAELAYSILDQRAECYDLMGEFKEALSDLDKMVEIAQALGNPAMQTAIAYRQDFTAARLGDSAKVSEIAEAIRKLEGKSDDIAVNAAIKLAVGYEHWVLEEKIKAQENFEQALQMYRAAGDQEGEANTLASLGSVLLDSGHQSLPSQYALDALGIWRSLGNRRREARSLNAWSLSANDYAEKRDAEERSLEIFEEINDRWGQSQMYNNLSLLYGHLGLYSTAREYATRAVDMVREMGAQYGLALYLDTLARAEMNLGEFSEAEKIFKEDQEVARKINSTIEEAYGYYGLGRVALLSGKPEEARPAFQSALDVFKETKIYSELPTVLAWLGGAYLALDDPESARMYTAEGVTQLEAIGSGGAEYPPQEIWWWHYQALTYELRQQKTARNEDLELEKIPENAWSALQKAREIALGGIASLSDEGLRRNYLNKVEINREIISEWADQAAIRGLEISGGDEREGNIQAQLQRQLAIGVRMNERREVEALIDFIMDELIELSGAERAMLLLVDESGERSIATSYGFEAADKGKFLKQADSLLKSVETTKMHVLRQDVHQWDIDATTEDPFEALSVLCVPLLSKGKLSGFIYADNHAIFGHFTQADVDLLAAFSNQVAAAIENAQLYQGLELRVKERTVELSKSNQALEQRNAELAVINSVQDGLAAQMEFEGIIELVGEKIRQVFDAQGIGIAIYDRKTNLVSIPYFVDDDQRIMMDTAHEPLGFTGHIIQSAKPLLVNRDLPKKMEELGSQWVGGDEDETRQSQSYLGVPIIIAGEVMGVISLTNYDREEAYSDSDVNLLSTLAASMSVALENARLFDEERQRSAELAIINSVQQALSSQLDYQEVINLVGDKLRDVFNTESIAIRIYDRKENLIHYLYEYENGEKFEFDPATPIGVTKAVIETQKPLVVNEDMENRMSELGSTILPGTDTPKSLVAVPILVGNEVIGTIQHENYERENAINEADVRLLTTLASSMSVALDNARLFDETNRLLVESRQRSAELAIINSVQQGLAEELDIPSIFELVGEKIREIFDAQVVLISLFDHENEMRSFPYHYEMGKEIEVEPGPFNTLTRKLINDRKTIVINEDMEARSEELGMIIPPGTEAVKSNVFVPMIVGDSVMGFVSLQNVDRENAFPESAVRLLTTLTNSMSVALENARLFEETNRLLEETRQQAAEMATVNTVGQALTAELELEALIELIGEQVRKIFSADITYVALYDRQTNLIDFPFAVGEELEPMQYGEGLTSKIIETGEPLLINEDVNRTVDEIGATHSGVDVQSYLGVPIIIGKQAIGVISVQSMKETSHFDEDDVRLLSTIAANVGVALRNAQLYQETQERADQMAALTEIGREISATLDLERVLERIATRAQELLRARTATIRLLDDDGNLPTVVAIGKYAEKHRGTSIKMGEGITGNVAKSGKAEIINDPRADERIVHIPGTPDEEDELEAIIFAPLMIGERVIGVMGLWRDKPIAGPFSEEDLAFLKGLARQAAIAIENARLFEEVQRQKLYSEALVQNSPVAIMTSDLDNKVVSWNPAAEQLFGYTSEEAIGVRINELISNGKADEEIANNFKQVEDGIRVKTVTQRYRKDDSPVDVELLALPVVMEGKRVGLIAIYHDITELLKARHEAEAANEAKSAFLATMSHEIRTPMNGVIGMTSLLMDTKLDDEQRDYTETIRNSGEALLTVINDILDFSKIEAGKMELEEQPFDLRDCLESSLDLLKFNASEKGVELAYEMASTVPSVIVGDITRLRQVLINLLNNGLKFTDQGEVVLSVTTEAVPIQKDGPYTLHFSVRDTGIGIPPDRVDRLFQAFSQVDASTSRKYGGTGLGLAISKRLSELMGGEMWVESVVGKGTTFHFTVAAPAGTDMKDREDLKGERPQLVGKRLLIVDDNLTNRRILGIQTRAWGMLSRETSEPKEALQWIKRGDPFDLAILDYHMPEMDGIELAEAIREYRQMEELPLVLFSSIGARESVMDDDQFAAFLMKPLKPSVLLDTLMNLFAGEVKRIEAEESKPETKLDPRIAENLPLRILLVEDNAVNQKLALRLLEQMGYRADLAGNGLEAIQAVGRQKYDVVLMDVQMPEMDGLEASRRICARWPRGERPHIIAMTANAMQGDRERCLEAGMDDYVSKPIRVNELVAALEKANRLETSL